jgi:hypothetical protein
MTEKPEEKKTEEQTDQEESEAPQQPAAPPRPPQVVEIRTPLDKPEFSWFLDTFMQKMGLSDRKQSAIMLTNMMYDMGLDPYSDLKDLQGAMEEMNSMLKNLPNTPTAMKVKDTMAGMYAAKAGRTLLERFPRVASQDPMMERMERIMDKYMPMIMGMKMVGELMRAEPAQQKQQAPTELPETVKAEMAELKQSVANVMELLSKQRADEKEKAFAESVIQSVNANITPQLQALQAQVDALAKQPPPPTAPDRTDEIKEISSSLKEAVDKLGEKAGAKSLSLADVDPILSIIDRLEQKFHKEPTGELDWKTATVSTLGEIGKEAVSAYRDVAQAKAASTAGQGQVPAPGNSEMQTVIKRQVQNYILQRIQSGAATMNIQEAAQTLGLTPEEVGWAYQTLMSEGWINVKVPAEKTGGGRNVQTQEKAGEPAANQPFVET